MLQRDAEGSDEDTEFDAARPEGHRDEAEGDDGARGNWADVDVVRLLFHRIAVDQAFPLELKVLKAQTRSAMAEVDEMVKTRMARFASADEMFAQLEEASGQ